MKFRPALLAAALATSAALILSGCAAGGASEDSGSESATGGTLTIATSTDQVQFDPTLANGGVILQPYQAVYDSIVRRAPDGRLEPMLATDWEYNDDRTELTLTIRDDVTFTDGSKLDAEAVKFNLEAFKNGNGPTSSSLAAIARVEAPAATTVVITLNAPDPALLDRLGATSGFVASPAAVADGSIGTAPVGSGPYILDASATVAGSEYTFTKNPDYWDPSLQKFEKIVIKSIVDTTATLNALLSGQVDAALLVAKTADQARRGGAFTEVQYPGNFNGLLIRDMAGQLTPELAIPEVRQAIAYAIDRETIVKQVYQGLGEVTNQIFDPSSAAYVPELDTHYEYDPEKAKELLEDAGVDGFTMKMPLFTQMDPAESAAVAQNLADIGITVEWEAIPAAEVRATLAGTNFSAMWWSLSYGNPWLTSQKLITPNANYNTFKYSDPITDELLDTVQRGSDEEQVEAAQEVNQYITEQAWFVPFLRTTQPYFHVPSITVEPQAQETVPSIYGYAPAQ